MTDLEGRWHTVLGRVATAARRAGRDPSEVTVVAAAKTWPPAVIASAVRAGIRDVGENYVQEAASKRAALGDSPIRWHLIGRLQRNKAGRAVELFDRIHSVDSARLAEAIEDAAAKRGRRVACLLQVNLCSEEQKAGVSPNDLEELLNRVARHPHLLVDGLMAIPPPTGSEEQSRAFFVRLRELRDHMARLRLPGVHLKELSMGMSADFEVAVEEGATMIRIGTALFGPRGASR